MVYVWYYRSNGEKLHPDVYARLIQQLPTSIQDQILKYRKWQDREERLIGKSLLLAELQFLGKPPALLTALKYTAFQRPYLDDAADFNISHSNGITVCAISETHRVGIDIEKCQRTNINDFEAQFSPSEWKQILEHKNSELAFFRLWTKKEAFLKATGDGLNIPLCTIPIEANKVALNNQEWFLHEIDLDKGYICHLCTPLSSPNIVIEEIQWNRYNRRRS